MNEQVTDPVPPSEQLSDILLVMDKHHRKVQVVKGADSDGKLETVDPIKKNQNQFLRVDKHGNMLSNFLSNFLSQLKNPTQFTFFSVPVANAVRMANALQKQMLNPDPAFTPVMESHEIKLEQPSVKQHNTVNMETTIQAAESGEYRYKPEQIDWATLSNFGLTKEKLERMNLLDPLLRGYKTNELVPVSLNLGTTVTRLDARLSLQPDNQGRVVVAIHGIRKEPQLNYPFFGHEFSKEDKENLLKSGNMGRVVELTNPKTGEKIPSIISVDRLTNELIALRTEKIRIPDEIKGVKLDTQQRQALLDGKPLFLEGMISRKGEPFNASVQFNADKRYVEFMFDRGQSNRQWQNSQQVNGSEAPKTVRGKSLDNEQYEKFSAGQTIYVTGLLDKQGKEYKGYLTFNKDTGKTDFSFGNPNKVKEKAEPAEAHKTQVAVNSEGKTNEATKNIKEPLRPEQKEAKNQQQQDQQKPAKSRGRKI